MRLRRESSILKASAVSSLRRAMAAFNSHDDDGRATEVLLKLQHSFEMLLKASLVQKRIEVFDRQLGQSIGFDKCVRLSQQHLRVTDEEAGTLRAVDALRDEAQHWFNHVTEGLLYAHTRAAVTLFDDLMDRAFSEKLVAHVPHRVLPMSAEPPKEIQLLIDEEFTQVAALLQPGLRRRAEARARLRTLLAMEAHVVDGVRVSSRDVDRVERGIRAGRPIENVFPRLGDLQTEITGEGVSVAVRFVRNANDTAMNVRFVQPDDPTEAAAIREVDLQRKYYLSATTLAERLGISAPKSGALRWKLNIDSDATCTHDFVFMSSRHRAYSDNALRAMSDALAAHDLDEIWREFRQRPNGPAATAT